MPEEKKTERERRKYLQPKNYEVFKKKEATRIREYCLKKRCQSNYWNYCQKIQSTYSFYLYLYLKFIYRR